ncbi:MAG: formylmethanofuran dehydrogenase [Rubrivivax sp.]|nr:formylmethanofuran dehydrogenase [Rubrivivax sp.]
MTDAVRPWSCPFCPLLCDAFGVVRAADGSLALQGSDCARARAALAHFGPATGDDRPRVHGRACELHVAVDAAAALLRTSRQPLFGGLGTDVAGARALYRLACDTGAICDAAQGAALTEGLRALQDRGGFTTTLAEVRTRVDLLVCFGGLPTPRHPEFFRHAGLAPDDPRVVVVAPSDDLFAASAQLAALVEGQVVDGASAELQALAQRLRAARYAVLVYEPARLPVHGALVIETLQRVVATLNRSTRAAALPLGGGDGAATVNQVFSWLSGLPLRTRNGPHGLEHEPVCFDAGRLVADDAVDLLLWIASFGPAPAPPACRLPRIVLGHPGMAAVEADVFIPVATPGIGADGHLFRTDGVVMLPLHAVRPEPLPTVADVLQRISAALRMERAA